MFGYLDKLDRAPGAIAWQSVYASRNAEWITGYENQRKEAFEEQVRLTDERLRVARPAAVDTGDDLLLARLLKQAEEANG